MTETLQKFITKAYEYGYEAEKRINRVFNGNYTLKEKVETSKRVKRDLMNNLNGLESGFKLVSNNSKEELEFHDNCLKMYMKVYSECAREISLKRGKKL